jgi:catechol 2,3-dioxygenase-like lactoylglutathione lyase family enzyme
MLPQDEYPARPGKGYEMGAEVAKEGIDLGIFVRDSEAALKFYRDTLGLEHVRDSPAGGGGTMHRLMCGDSMIKVIALDDVPEPANPPGGPSDATGMRYWTISVSNLDELVAACEAAGYNVPVPPREVSPESRPNTRIAFVEDPDGNRVELLEDTSPR